MELVKILVPVGGHRHHVLHAHTAVDGRVQAGLHGEHFTLQNLAAARGKPFARLLYSLAGWLGSSKISLFRGLH